MVTAYEESPPLAGAVRKDAYARPEGSPSFPVTPPLLVLRGTWWDMGVEYGQHAGVEIREVSDSLLLRLEEVLPEGESLAKKLQRYRILIEELSPEMLEFMEGIAEGASLELEKSGLGSYLDSMQKIILINCFSSLDGEFADLRRELVEEGSAWECRGPLTAKGDPLMGANMDGALYPLMYRLALVVVPDDPDSFIYFSLPLAGSVSGPLGLNEEGLALAAPAVWTPSDVVPVEEGGKQQGEVQDEKKPDLPISIMCALALSEARDVNSAKELLTYGPKDIAGQDEREGLLSCQAANFLLSDHEDALVLERDPSHYGLRGEEDLPNGGSLIAATDHFTGLESYKENDEPLGHPMNELGLSQQDVVYSVVRLHSLDQLFQNIDEEIDSFWAMREIAGMNHIYDEQGQKTYQAEAGNGATVSCFESGLTVDRYLEREGVPAYGTIGSFVVNLATLDVWFELGIPSDWVGPWEHISLDDYLR